MKKHFLTLLMVLSLIQFGYAQVPSAIPYQAVVRNGNGNILPNHPVQLRFTIHDSITNGNVVYQETHSISTNAQGLVITNIGQGTSTTGTFSGINWGKNNKFVQTELSINNDNTYTDLGTTQFLSVPYALHSGNGMPNGNSDGEMLYWSNGQWVKVAPGSQGQTLTLCDGKPHWGACPPVITPIYYGNGLTDIDGNTYDTVSICNQVWMKQNLNVSRYRNGDIIPQVTDPTQWANLTTGAWCYYNNDSSNGSVYGKFYNWYAVNDPRGLAPEGWHVPSDEEWTTLTDCLGGSSVAGGKMKEVGTTQWKSPNAGASNSSGFSGLPGGFRDYDGSFLGTGNFNLIGNNGVWWSSAESSTAYAWYRHLFYDVAYVGRISSYKTYGFSIRCIKDNTITTSITLPTLSTDTISSITTTSATSGGNITNDGGGNITTRGICWSTSNNPTIDLTTKTTDGTGTGSFTSSITGLSPNTTYYVRAYATNSAGTSYGNEMSFTTQSVNNNAGVGLTDIDGNTYDTVRICNQTWTKKNLNVSRYRNGDIIPQVTDPTQWANLTTGAWCYYNNDSANGAVYGKLYNWYAVNDPRGLAPEGWHVPSDGEWNKMTKCLDANADTTNTDWQTNTQAGGMLKSTYGWDGESNGSNSSGFNGLPGGVQHDNSYGFDYIGGGAYWWSNSEYDNNSSWIHGLNIFNTYLYRGYGSKGEGLSVRLVKDEPPSTLNNGLVAYYPFNGNANDESGNGNNGVVNGATLTTDRFGNNGKAYSFDGLDDYIICDNNTIPVYSNQTVSFYSKFNSFTNWPDGIEFICLGSPASTSWGIFESSTGSATKNMGRGCNGTGSVPLNSVFSTNTWCHYSFATDFTLGVTKIYKNGNFIGQVDNGTVYGSCSQNNLYFGVDIFSLPEYFNGYLDDIRIYNRALTQEEISYLATH